MIDIATFREQGYLYDTLENYTDLFSFEDFKEIKSFIDSNDIKRYSRYDYWFKYDELSYIEQLEYDNYLLRDKDLNTADKMFLCFIKFSAQWKDFNYSDIPKLYEDWSN